MLFRDATRSAVKVLSVNFCILLQKKFTQRRQGVEIPLRETKKMRISAFEPKNFDVRETQ